MRAEEITSTVVMALARGAREIERFFLLTRAGGGGHGQKLVSDFSQRADDHYRAFRQAFAHDGFDAVDGLRVLHGGAAEFHDDHERPQIHHGGTETRRKAKHEPKNNGEDTISRDIPVL